MTVIGAHLHEGDPLEQAQAMGADIVQFFLGDPQGWKAPVLPGEPAQLRDSFAAAGVGGYIHSPYVINVASPNNRIRIPSRKILEQQLKAAASIGARGLIVHGGHVTADTDPAEGYDSWRKAVERIDRPLPMLIENTAGGDSRDEFGSGRDRHAPLESGQIDPALILDVVRAAGAPVICETPDPAVDIRWLRAQLG
jgi:deoxyribonuclease IV